MAPVVATPADPEQLLRELTDARVVAPEQATGVLAEVRSARAAATAAALADFLVQASLLTPYQAERALSGDAAKLTVGPYLLLEPVGSGSLGTVYRALHRADRHRYAVKVLPLRSMWNVMQARRQVEVFAGLPPHPAVVPFVDIGTAGASHYLAWPFVEGEPLDQLVRRAGPLPPAHAARLLTDVADGLAVCHQHGIVHGLLKPSNLLLGPDRTARVLDLGIGAILTDNVADDESLLDTISTANTAMGMLDCAAPETLADPTDRTVPGDMYGLGCVLYFVLAGVYPFPDGTAVDKILAHQTQEPPPVRRRNPDVPEPLADLVARLLRKAPADRPASMAEVRDALAAAAPAGVPVPDLPTTAVEQWAVRAARGPVSMPVTPRAKGPAGPDAVSFEAPALQETSTSHPVPTPPRPVSAPSPQAPPPPGRPPAPRPPKIALDIPPNPVAWSQPSGTRERHEPVVPPPPQVGWFAQLVRRVCFWLPPVSVVQVSVFGPRRMAPGETARLQVYAHPPVAFGSVRTLSRAFQPDTELLATGYADRPVPRSAELGLHLAVANAGVAKSLVRFGWVGQTRPWAFEVYVPWESPPGETAGVLSVGVNNAQAGQVTFEVQILPRSR